MVVEREIAWTKANNAALKPKEYGIVKHDNMEQYYSSPSTDFRWHQSTMTLSLLHFPRRLCPSIPSYHRHTKYYSSLAFCIQALSPPIELAADVAIAACSLDAGGYPWPMRHCVHRPQVLHRIACVECSSQLQPPRLES